MKVFNLRWYLFEMKYGAIGCIHFYRQSARKFLLYSINQVEETINKNNYVLLILSLTETSHRYFSSVFQLFFFFSLRFNRLSHFITRIRQLLDHNSITRLSSLLYSSDCPPEWSIGICLISVSAFHPFILPLKGMCLFIVLFFLPRQPSINRSSSLFFSLSKFFPHVQVS